MNEELMCECPHMMIEECIKALRICRLVYDLIVHAWSDYCGFSSLVVSGFDPSESPYMAFDSVPSDAFEGAEGAPAPFTVTVS